MLEVLKEEPIRVTIKGLRRTFYPPIHHAPIDNTPPDKKMQLEWVYPFLSISFFCIILRKSVEGLTSRYNNLLIFRIRHKGQMILKWVLLSVFSGESDRESAVGLGRS